MESKEHMKFDLNMHTARLLMREPFFASLSRNVTKVASTAIPTAGVRVNPDTARFEMMYNPEFFEGLSDKERTAVLIHEFYHLVFQHVTERRPEGVEMKQWNIAADLAINCHIDGLPETACVPGVGPFADFERDLSAEAYLALLQQKKEEESEKGESENGEGIPDDNGFDSHDEWGKGDATAKEIAKERVKEYLREAAEDAQKANTWGSVSATCRREIMERLTTRLDWKSVLRYFVKTSRRASQRSSVKRL